MKFLSHSPMFCLVLTVLCLAGCETKTPDQKLVGKWQIDRECIREMARAEIEESGFKITDANRQFIDAQIDEGSKGMDIKMEFSSDRIMRLFYTSPELSNEFQGEWTVIRIDEQEVTIELTIDRQSTAFQEVVFLDDDTFELTGLGAAFNNIKLPGPNLRFKRVESGSE